MDGGSPGWKQPPSLVRLKKKRRRNSAPVPTRLGSSGDENQVTPARAAKRRNPFGQDNQAVTKKSNIADFRLRENTQTPKSAEEHRLFTSLDGITNSGDDRIKPNEDIKGSNIKIPAPRPEEKKTNVKDPVPPRDKKVSENCHCRCPVDWCMRTKVRFVSDTPFSWCWPIRSGDQVEGTTSFIKNSCTEFQSHEEGKQREFWRHCHYWQHPNLPWLKLFPRIVTNQKIGKTNPILQDEDAQKALYRDWAESLTSAFQSLKTGTCPFFYICTHQMTALFRAAKVSKVGQCHALLTPTTRGLREALDREGIEYTMPLCEKKALQDPDGLTTTEATVEVKTDRDETEGSQPSSDASAASAEPDEPDDGASEWLQSMGLNKRDFPSLEPHRVKLQRDGFRVIDNRPESLVFVQGPETQALINYLLNCRSCISPTGPLGGVPPTIFAPVVFKGATLKTLQVRQGSLRQDGGKRQAYNLELTGPVLPQAVQGLSGLLKHTQQQFSVVFSNHDVTAPFNAPCHKPSQDMSQHQTADQDGDNIDDKMDDILDEEWISCASDLGRHCMVNMVYDGEEFSWTL